MLTQALGNLFPGWIPAVLTGVLGLVTYYIVYSLYWAPLSQVPGPTISALTEYWILYKTWNEERIRLTHSLHEKYGPIVRLSPVEVSFADPETIRTIYVGNFDKSGFYGQFGNFDRLNAFSTLGKQGHVKRRKVISPIYSKSSVCSPQNEARTQERIADTMAYITSHRKNTVEVYNVFHALAMDTVTGFLLGDENGSHFLRSGDWSIIESYRLQSAMWFWTTLMPRFYDYALDKATKFAVGATANWCKSNSLPAAKAPSPLSVMSTLKNAGLADMDACSEIQDHTAAGHETTGATLTFLTYHLSTHPEIQEKLHQELVNAFGKPTGELFQPLPYKLVDDLPYLNGVVMETLRLYSAIPGAEPRVVPDKGMQYGPYNLPPNTVVSIQPWTVHRDANVYPSPLEFKPERWFESDPEQLRLMNRSFMAFGAGVRMCVGMNLALQEIKLIVASIYRMYSTRVADGYDHDKMYIVDKYTTHPLGHECLLNFTPIAACD